jgi:hypothetical protein
MSRKIAFRKSLILGSVWMLAGSFAPDLNRDYFAGYSIYEGRRFKGQVTHTIVRGRYAVRDGVLTNDAVGSGRYVNWTARAAKTRPMAA